WKISFAGLRTIVIGASPAYPNLYDRIKVTTLEGKNLYQLHELLSFFNLDDALVSSSYVDIERLKIGHLFRTFYPKEATLLERSQPFFTLPIEELKAAMIEKAPEMEQLFTTY